MASIRSANPPQRTRVLGLPVDSTEVGDVLALAEQAVAEGRRLRIVVTNANKCFLAVRDPGLREFLERAELVVPETSVVWGARVLGRSGVHPVWGVALAAELLARADQGRWSVFLLGAREEVCDSAAAAVRLRFPGARLVGHHHGYLSGEGVRASVIRALEATRPQLLLVGMGSPRQERFLASLSEAAAPGVALGVGGTFDVLAGIRRGAPAWIRGSGFEWLWRSAQNPRLLARYLLVNPWFVGAVLRERLRGASPGSAAGSAPGSAAQSPSEPDAK